MDAAKRSISEIFNGSRILEIPFFQRSYVWKEEQWRRLLEDMKQISISKSPYFFGSVILKQQHTSTGSQSGDLRILIDGQQRLTTLNIFFKVLCLKYNNNNDYKSRFFLQRDKTIALKHNHNNVVNFEKVINMTDLEVMENPSIEYCHIKGAYNYFSENIDVDDFDFFDVIENIMFVAIDLSREEDEQRIFDTINSLGVRLSTAELLKNHLFDRKQQESYNKKWKCVFEKDDETKAFWDKELTAGRIKRQNIDLFFYSFLQIKIQDRNLNIKADDKKNFSKHSKLFESYKEFMGRYNVDKDELINEIKVFAKLYRDNIDLSATDRELSDDFGMERINILIFGLDYTVIIPFVLYILKNSNVEQKTGIFEYLESYLMRRIITKSITKSYSKLFSEELIFNGVNTIDKFRKLILEKTDKTNSIPTNSEVNKGFHESRLINKQAAGVIYLMESRIRNRTMQSTALLGLNRYSLEHLMPKKWKNNWSELDNEEKRINRNNKLLTLGNLAIITSSLNTSIRDSGWKDKKEGVGNRAGLKAFASGIETLDKFLDLDVWNESEIEKRADHLYEESMKIWEM